MLDSAANTEYSDAAAEFEYISCYQRLQVINIADFSVGEGVSCGMII